MARRKIIDKQPSAQEGLEVASRYGADERRRGFSPRLKVIFLGGLNQIGRNITAYEYGEDGRVRLCAVRHYRTGDCAAGLFHGTPS